MKKKILLSKIDLENFLIKDKKTKVNSKNQKQWKIRKQRKINTVY